MADLPTIDFVSWKDPRGYRLARTKPDNILRVARDGHPNEKLVACRPLDETRDLFRIFAVTVRTEEDVFRFVQRYGPLTHYGNSPGDIVEYVIFHANAIRSLLNSVSIQRREPPRLPGKFDITAGVSLDAAVVWDHVKKSPRWELRPRTLLDGLWLQFGQAVTRGARIRACTHCGEWFETGAGTGRRLDAKFCCDQHRTAFNSLKRSREK